MKNRGFTLIELLATIVILGIIMVIAVPNVTGILQKNKAKAYYEDAKKLVTLAEYKMRGDSSVQRPSGNQCLVMNLYYLDNSEFENAPNGGAYNKTGSFVVIKKDGSSYKYYVRLLEEMTEGASTSYRGISFEESSNLYDDVDITKIKNVTSIFSVDTTTNTNKATAMTNINTLGITCDPVIGKYAVTP